MLPSYFDYIFVYLKPKVRLRPELSPKFWSTLGPNPARTRARPEKPGETYNSGPVNKTSATETVHLGSIPTRVKPKTIKIVFTASFFEIQL